MRSGNVAALCAALLLCGCATAPPPEDPEVWGRVDCQRAEGNPMLTQEFEQARTICKAGADAAGLSGSAGYYGGGLAGAVGQGIRAGQISQATGIACMGERGWLLRPRSAHLAACEAIEAQKAAEQAKRVPPTKPRPVPPTAKPGAT